MLPLNKSFIAVSENGCWLFSQGLAKDGYCKVKRGGKMYPAHRWSWMIERGPIPAGLLVLHKCDVRNCVNPDHLFIGTHKDNTKDMFEKRRNKPVSDAFRFSMRGKPHSEIHNKRIGEANSRRVITAETRRKRSENAINYWKKRKGI